MSMDQDSFEDLLNQAEVRDFLRHAETEMFPKMKVSAMTLVIGTEDPDIKLALEIGAAILFDKPLLVVMLKGRKVSAGLRRVAHTVIEIDDFISPESMAQVREAITNMLERKAR